MPLFNESLESIAQAIVTVKRALKASVIEKEKYKELEDYLNQRAKDFKLKKSHVAEAKRNLEDELQAEVEFFMKKGDALYKWAEELLEDFNGDKEDEEFSKWSEKIFEDFKAADIEEDELDVCEAWAKMNNKERAAMAELAMNWQMRR